MALHEEDVLEPAPGTTGPLDDHLQALVQEVDRLKVTFDKMMELSHETHLLSTVCIA